MSDTTQSETPISEETSQPTATLEPTEPAPISPSTSEQVEVPSVAPEAPPEAESAIPANNPSDVEATADTATAQPVEPLDLEPISEPQSAPESLPELSVPASEPAQAPEPVSAPEPKVITPVPLISRARELLVKARETIQFRKHKKLEKIMGLFLKKQSISNDDVQKLLYVSDATATRYLKQLETEGKVRRQGVPGHASYSRI